MAYIHVLCRGLEGLIECREGKRQLVELLQHILNHQPQYNTFLCH
jgi:hypothetical protein